MTWNPLTATLASWIITIPISHWAKMQLRQRTRNPWARRWYLLSAASACVFAIWAVSLGGWWLAWLAVEGLSLVMVVDAATKVDTGEVPKWAEA